MEAALRVEDGWRGQLEARVLKNQAILSVEELTDGGLRVEVPLKRRWFMSPPMSLIFPFRRTRHLQLDPLGAEVFRACDSEGTVESIIDWFADREKLSFHESRLVIQHYLRMLMGQGLVALEGNPGTGS